MDIASTNAEKRAESLVSWPAAIVGDLDLPFETFPLGDGPSQFLLTYTAEPASPSQDALNLLACWAATNDDIEWSAPANDSEPADSAETPD
ncbi:hypothetical protein OH799_05910 [Nocardia sp. NBC_00881]|uniref:MmyB family transcriptional regulator n=1 Tax=Nocardia sp. NBC_00881 TaxID=2975995 RepID=UPI00386AEFF4|nr:hypothetical protein OH799_05910 [Nocardia sp. NBC_00881]